MSVDLVSLDVVVVVSVSHPEKGECYGNKDHHQWRHNAEDEAWSRMSAIVRMALKIEDDDGKENHEGPGEWGDSSAYR